MKFFILLLALSFNLSCETVKETVKTKVCDEYNKALDKGSLSIAASLECEDPTAVRADLAKYLDKLKLCKMQKEVVDASPVANAVCPLVARYATSAVSKKVPKSWKCKSDKAVEKLFDTVNDACKGLLKL